MEKSTDSNAASSSSSSSTQPAPSSEGGSTSSVQPQQNLKPNHTVVGSQATNSNDGNQQQHQHQHQHHSASAASLLQPTAMTMASASASSLGPMFVQNHQQNSSCNPTQKNQHNSLGCGPSSSTAASTSGTSTATFDNNGNLNSRTATMSLNNSSLGHHQSCYTNAAAAPSNGVSAGNITTTTSVTTPSSSSSLSSQMAPINLNISTTTGGNFSVSVDPQITVENLKKIIAKKLKVAKDRICLLHREKELQDGSLKENNLMDGSKIILIPNVETGLLAQRPENTVMQALESLNDSQVNDFLSGKTPLNLSMRLGDHMMLIQLQLSTVNPVNGTAHSSSNCSSSSRTRSNHHHHHHHHRSSSSRGTSTASAATQTPSGAAVTPPSHSHHHHHHHHHHHGSVPGSIASAANPLPVTAAVSSTPATAQNVPTVRKLELEPSAVRTSVSSINTSSTSSSVSMIAAAPTTMASQQIKNTSKRISTSGASPASAMSVMSSKSSDLSSYLSKRDYESLQNIVKSIALAQQPSRLLAPVTSTNSSNSVQITSNSATALTTPLQPSIVPVVATTSFHAPSSEAVLLEQSPIKSLSNLVSSPIKTTPIKSIPNISNNNSSSSSSATNSVALGPLTTPVASGPATNSAIASSTPICQDPIAAKLTSCLCTRLNGGSSTSAPHASAKQCIETSCISQQQPQQHHLSPGTSTVLTTSTPNYKATSNVSGNIVSPPMTALTSRSFASLHKTAHNVISRKHRHHHHHHHHHHHYHHSQGNNGKIQPMVVTSTPTRGVSNDSGFNSSDDSLNSSNTQSNMLAKPVASVPAVAAAAAPVGVTTAPLASANLTGAVPVTAAAAQATATSIELDDSGIVSDSRTLAEASRNLTQTLRKLSKEVFTNKIDFSASEEAPRKSGSGAVIESMKNHGKGIYSGTFSGTLNPALQDRYGRPKRDISTVIHILNDLLSATPQYHRGARISFEAPSTSAAAAASVAAASGSPGTIHHSSRSKHLSSKHHHSSHPCVKCIKTQQHASTSSISTSGNISAPAASRGITTSNGPNSSSCAYGECNGHYVSKSQTNKSYPCCQHASNSSNSSSSVVVNGSSDHHSHNSSSSSSSSHHHHHHHHQTSGMVDDRKVCQCRFRIHSETGEREREHTCQKCATEMDNMKTKSKLDQLRLVMQQRKQKREARKQKGAPYGARVVSTTTTAAAAGVSDAASSTLSAANTTISTPISVAAATTAPSEVSPSHIVEEVDTAA